MIKIEKIDVFGWETAIRGMRNPLNSWDKSDTCWVQENGQEDYIDIDFDNLAVKIIGPNDLALMKKLVNAGSDHSKFMRMINVTCDIIAPLYWWKEFDTYKVGTIANSCSTMHKIHDKEFTLDDFSHEHLISHELYQSNLDVLQFVIDTLNFERSRYIKTKDKTTWWQMIQLLPSSYNQKRTVQLNYAVLRNMYHARRNHKLDEWHTFCDWVKTLPHSELITGETR